MNNGGSYPNAPKVELLEDGRIVKLLEDFIYIDPKGTRWTAPRGARADGASIPRPLWSIMGGPFEGKYRNGALVHDFYCSKRNKPWKAVHRMFYDAITTSGVGKKKAQIMYAAVYWGGPKWTEMDVYNALISVLPGDPGVGPPALAYTLEKGHRETVRRENYDFDRILKDTRKGAASHKGKSAGVKAKGAPPVRRKKVVSVKTPALTEEDLDLLTKRLKTDGDDLRSIEKQVEGLLKQRG